MPRWRKLHVKDDWPKGLRKACGYVYVFRSRFRQYKIGQSRDWQRRLKELRRQHGHDLEPILIIPSLSRKRDEQHFQDLCSRKHISGEWFKLDEGDLSRIRRQAALTHELYDELEPGYAQ